MAGIWVYETAGAFRRSGAKVPTDVRIKVERRAQHLIDSTLKARYIHPPPKKAKFNYLVDIYCKWRGIYFYLILKYCCPGPDALMPFFEMGLARLQYAGQQRFNLAYFRHTWRWEELAQLLS